MEATTSNSRTHRGGAFNGTAERGRRGHPHVSKNKTWVAESVSATRNGASNSRHHSPPGAEKRERGGYRGGRARGRGRGGRESHSPRPLTPNSQLEDAGSGTDAEETGHTDGEAEENPIFDSPEELSRFYRELLKAREAEKRRAIAEGKMNDPAVAVRLEDAIAMVGTCKDMCPRFERYRREREKNLFEWERLPGTYHVDHKRAVKAYERAAGDKSLPSDLRPPEVLKKTLDYLFHDLQPREGFHRTFDFIRDRSRAVRIDFSIQRSNGQIAMECHERCARFSIVALHLERDQPGFVAYMEEQQLMYTLMSLKEFYEAENQTYKSPQELEMRTYHRLIHIRDQVERNETIRPEIMNHPVFTLTTRFRQQVQAVSSPITKTSTLKVDDVAMAIFAELAKVLVDQGSQCMVYLVACILEFLFGKDTIDNIEGIREGLEIQDIIDGVPNAAMANGGAYIEEGEYSASAGEDDAEEPAQPQTIQPSATQWLTNNFGTEPNTSVFGPSSSSTFGQSTSLTPSTAPRTNGSASGSSTSAFGGPSTSQPVVAPAFSGLAASTSGAFGKGFGGSGSAFGGGSAFGASSGSAFGSSSGSAFGPPSKPSAFGAKFGPPSVPPPDNANDTKPSTTSVFGSTTFGAPAPSGSTSSSSPFGGPAPQPQQPSPPPAKPSSAFGATKPTFSLASAPPLGSTSESPPPSLFGGSTLNPAAASFSPPVVKTVAPKPQTPQFGQQPQSTPVPQPSPFSGFGQQPQSTPVPQPPPFSGFGQQPQSTPVPHPSSFSGFGQTSTSGPTPSPFGSTSTPNVPEQKAESSRSPVKNSSLFSISPSPAPPPTAPQPSQPPSTSTPQPNPTPFVPITSTNTSNPPLPRRKSSSSRPTVPFISTTNLTVAPPPLPSPATPLPEPPPLSKNHVISLPPTPTMPNFQSPVRTKSLVGLPAGSFTQEEVLSPLMLSGPSLAGQKSFVGSGTGSGSLLLRRPSLTAAELETQRQLQSQGQGQGGPSTSTPPVAPSPTKAKPKTSPQISTATFSAKVKLNGDGKKAAGDKPTKEERAAQKKRAAQFAFMKTVKPILKRWRERAAGRLKWAKAVERSDAYSKKVREQKSRREIQHVNGKKRRDSSGHEDEEDTQGDRTSRASREEKRKVRRTSKKREEPRSDEMLADRLRENHEQHEQRWKRGSLLDAARSHFISLAEGFLFDYRIWLSTNPDNDETAIWVDRKFDVPKSGQWFADNVFSIPLKEGDLDSTSPGLIVFERTPHEGAKDEIERKMRTLEDCGRLRDIVEGLPSDRHFVPSVLFISWTNIKENVLDDDLLAMTQGYVAEKKLEGYGTLPLTTKTADVDEKFTGVLASIPLDLCGKLAELLSWQDLLRIMVTPWKDFAADWASRSTTDHEVDWDLCSQIMRALIECLNTLATSVITRFVPGRPPHVLPDWPPSGIDSSDSLYDAMSEYLSDIKIKNFSEDIQRDLQSYRSLGKDFPIRAFADQLYTLALSRIELCVGADTSLKYPTPKNEIEDIWSDTQQTIEETADKLRRTLAFHVRPKRRRSRESSDNDSESSPHKKAKTATTETSPPLQTNGSSPPNNGHPVPSPSVSPSASSSTINGSSSDLITPAMLMQRARAALKKYGS